MERAGIGVARLRHVGGAASLAAMGSFGDDRSAAKQFAATTGGTALIVAPIGPRLLDAVNGACVGLAILYILLVSTRFAAMKFFYHSGAGASGGTSAASL